MQMEVKMIPIRSICVAAATLVAVIGCCVVAGADSSLPAELEGGWAMSGSVETFDPSNLYEHINGEAELFFPYGFKRLETVVYSPNNNPKTMIDADIFEMGSVLDAFGVYSSFRDAAVKLVPVGAEGFLSSTQLSFYKDRFFVQVTDVTGLGNLGDTLLACGKAIDAKLGGSAAQPAELAIVTIDSVNPLSVKYLAKSVLGYPFFKRGFTADVTVGGQPGRVFVLIENSPEAAKDTAYQYAAYLNEKGGSAELACTPDGPIISGQDPLYKSVETAQTGLYIIGVIGAVDKKAAQELLEVIAKQAESVGKKN